MTFYNHLLEKVYCICGYALKTRDTAAALTAAIDLLRLACNDGLITDTEFFDLSGIAEFRLQLIGEWLEEHPKLIFR